MNTKDHNTFQEQINSYLQGTPDDVFTWFAGYRMQFFAGKGLASPIDDVWQKIGSNFPEPMKQLSKGADGKYYFVPRSLMQRVAASVASKPEKILFVSSAELPGLVAIDSVAFQEEKAYLLARP